MAGEVSAWTGAKFYAFASLEFSHLLTHEQLVHYTEESHTLNQNVRW